MLNKTSNTLILSVLAVFFIVIAPNWLAEGMFMDGLIYSSISLNMATGQCSFWEPSFTKTFITNFDGHPPLSFWLESWFFKWFNLHPVSERIYAMIMYLGSFGMMHLIWKKLLPERINGFWLALLFFVLFPLIGWSVSNGLIENTLMFFTLGAVYFLVLSVDQNRLYLLLGGLFIFLATLTKGPVGLFPLGFYMAYQLAFPSTQWMKTIGRTVALIASVVLCYVVLFVSSDQALSSLQQYFQKQIVESAAEVQVVDHRFVIIGKLLQELIAAASLTLVLFIVQKTTQRKQLVQWSSTSSLFLIVGLMASLPIMITLKQRGFYLIPSLPYFALFFGSLIHVPIVNWNKWLKPVAVVLSIVAIGLNSYFFGEINRDKEKLEDVIALRNDVAPGDFLGMSKDLFSDWSGHGYFYRYNQVSLDGTLKRPHQYLITRRGGKVPEGYQLKTSLKYYDLFEKKTVNPQ